ncbi:MAG: acyl carrier protein [Spirochaetales bacterium]
MKEKTKNFLIKVLGFNEEDLYTKTDLVEDLNYDVFDINEMIGAIEDEYNCWVKASDREKMKTVQDVIECIERHEREEAKKWDLDEEEDENDELDDFYEDYDDGEKDEEDDLEDYYKSDYDDDDEGDDW